MSKHTPGPWVVRHDDMVCSKEGRIIADCESTSYNMRPAPPIVEDKANATLIAAAPAMYALLKRAAISLQEYCAEINGDMNDSLACEIEATIAQAEGVSHE